jgi:hypothetical protein
MTVVFEVLSPGNTYSEMDNKQLFYEEHGVEEYYVYDPAENKLRIFLRKGEILVRQRSVQNFISPRLGIRFDLSGDEMVVYGPTGQRFLTFEEIEKARERAEQRAGKAEQRAARAIELSRKVLRGEASAEERAELESLQ